jgi:hypothetical protein
MLPGAGVNMYTSAPVIAQAWHELHVQLMHARVKVVCSRGSNYLLISKPWSAVFPLTAPKLVCLPENIIFSNYLGQHVPVGWCLPLVTAAAVVSNHVQDISVASPKPS